MPPLDGGAEIYIVGLGLNGTHQITTEGWYALRSSCQRLILHYDPLVLAALAEIGPYETFDDLYAAGRDRHATYQDVAGRVLDCADGGPRPVCFALYGHPLVFVSPTQIIVSQAKERGLRVVVQPGISALDCLLVDLNLDPATSGLQQYEATDLLVRERPLQPDVPALIWQIGTVGVSAVLDGARLPPAAYEYLAEYFARFYPPTHGITVVRTATNPLFRSRFLQATVETLPNLAGAIGSADTLYIPPTQRRAVANTRILDLAQAQTDFDASSRT